MTRPRTARVEPLPLIVRHRILVGRGPEHVAPDGHGRLLTGVEDGRVLRVDPAPPHTVEQVAHTGDPPLGSTAQTDGRVQVWRLCAAHRPCCGGRWRPRRTWCVRARRGWPAS
ncbi:hypothetical protein ACPCVO_47950 [Streptomyces umbrinus]|uniref:hypothetical protein n=1 Tax=Streptomyces umbrinus TaxID=67370 RepID=UPI003C302354